MNNCQFKWFLLLLIVLVSNVSAVDKLSLPKSIDLCVGCHGSNGIGLEDEYPNLAGQQKNYLFKQLNDFRSGARANPSMNAIAKTLKLEDMRELSHYFSSLKSSPPAIAKKALTSEILTTSPLILEDTFADNIFVSLKKAGNMIRFPNQKLWKGGPNMLYTAISPDGNLTLTTSPSSDSLYAFDARTGNVLKIIKVGKSPKGVKISPNGLQAYVSNQGSSNISVIDLQTLTLMDTISVESGPHNVRFTKNGDIAYVTLQGGAGIGVINTSIRKMVEIIATSGITGPHNLDLSLNEKILFVRDFVNNVAVVDLPSKEIIRIIKVGKGHGGIDVLVDGKLVVTAAIAENFITIIDTKTFENHNIFVGNGPHGVRASADNRWIYVTLTRDNAIAIVNTKTLKLERTIPVGEFPFWIAVNGNP